MLPLSTFFVPTFPIKVPTKKVESGESGCPLEIVGAYGESGKLGDFWEQNSSRPVVDNERWIGSNPQMLPLLRKV